MHLKTQGRRSETAGYRRSETAATVRFFHTFHVMRGRLFVNSELFLLLLANGRGGISRKSRRVSENRDSALPPAYRRIGRRVGFCAP
jgi:hypothetical protein